MAESPLGISAFYFSKRGCAILLCIMTALVLAFSALAAYLSAPGDQADEITNWQYVCDTRLRALETVNTQWQTADPEHPIRPEPGSSYIRLKGTLPVSSRDVLSIRSANSAMRVEIDGEHVYDTLERDLFAGSQINTIMLEPSDRERELDIILYIPLSFSFSAYLTGGEGSVGAAAPTPYVGFFIGLFLLLAGSAVCMLFRLVFRRRIPQKPVAYIFPILTMQCGLLILLEKTASRLASMAPSVLYNTIMALWILVLWLVPFSTLLLRMGWNTRLETLTAINILYAGALLFWPYDIFLINLIKAGLILQLANLMVFIYCVVHDRLKLDTMTSAALILFFGVDILYWQGLISQSWVDFGIPIFMAILLYILCAGYVFMKISDVSCKRTERKSPGEGRTKRRQKHLFADTMSADMPEVSSAARQVELTAVPAPSENERGLIYSRLKGRMIITESMWRLIEDKCDGPCHHLLHVAEYTRALCYEMGFGAERTAQIADAALLHDIGKLSIPWETLQKTEKLTDAEFREIRRHNLYGYQLLCGESDPFTRLAAQIAREHHENMDGTGYLGLKGMEISLPARIVSVADVFDALTSPRSYKKAWTFDQAFAYVLDRAGEQFDPDVVEAFRRARTKILNIYQIYREQLRNEAVIQVG